MSATAHHYVRFSSKIQGSGSSEERQDERGREWAERYGYAYRQIADRGLSAYTGEHILKGQLGAFLADVAAGRVAQGDVLLVESLDRLSRQSLMDAVGTVTDICRRGLGVADISAGRLYDRDAGVEAFLGMVLSSARAREESKVKGERITSAWRLKRVRARGGNHILTKMLPYGYKIEGRTFNGRTWNDDGRIVVDPETGPVAQRIFRDYAKGRSQALIARDLTREGIPSPTVGRRKRAASQWHQASVRIVLLNAAYKGDFVRWDKPEDRTHRRELERIPGYYPVLVDETLWRRVQDRLAENTVKKSPHRCGSTNLFTGIGKCGRCGGPMIAISKNAHAGRKLICINGRNGSGLCQYKELRAAEAESCVLNALADHLEAVPPASNAPDPQGAGGLETRKAAAARRIAEAEGDLSKMRKSILLLDPQTNRKPYQDIIDQAEADLESLRGQLSRIEAEAAAERRRHDDSIRLAGDFPAMVRRVVHGLETVVLSREFMEREPDEAEWAAEMARAAEMQEERRARMHEYRVEVKDALRSLVERIDLDAHGKTYRIQTRGGAVIEGQVDDRYTSAERSGGAVEVDWED